jgi:hypothetical protein
MSAINRPSLDIFPPVLTPFARNDEVFHTCPHPCPYCNGTGRVNGRQTGACEYVRERCPICEGKGEVKAKITIAWGGVRKTC